MKFTIFVTSKCNLKCKYCYEGHDKPNKDMTFNIADKTIEFIIDKLKKSKDTRPLGIIFHGGEPLLNFELIKYMASSILEKVKDRRVIFDMTTNGTIINDEIINYSKNHIDNISVSIDGTKDAHDLNRIFSDETGSYETVIANVRRLLGEGIPIRARMTFNSQNVDKLYEGVKSIANMGFKYIVPTTDNYDKLWNQNHIETLKSQILKIIDIGKEYPDSHISLTELRFLNMKKGDCFGGINSFSIDESGNIYPCTFSVGNKDFIIGNVDKSNLLEDRVNQLCKVYQSENKDCLGCTRYEYCTGVRCKILNKLITGDYEKPPGIVCATQNISVDIIKKLTNIS